MTETEAIEDKTSFTAIVNQFRGLGIKLAIDDFGAGFSGLNLLASFQPDLVKLDMELVRNIDSQGPRQAIVAAIIRVCFELGIDIIAEGVETVAEFEWLRSHGVELFQGYLFAKPMFEGFPSVFDPSNI